MKFTSSDRPIDSLRRFEVLTAPLLARFQMTAFGPLVPSVDKDGCLLVTIGNGSLNRLTKPLLVELRG